MPFDAADLDALVSKIKFRIDDFLTPGHDKRHTIIKAFDDVDEDASGFIDKREFRTVLESLRIEVTDYELQSLFERYSSDTDKRVLSQRNWINMILEPADLNSVISKIKFRMQSFIGPGHYKRDKLMDAFNEVDEDGNGIVDRREFGVALKNLGIDVTAAELQGIFHRYAGDESRENMTRSGFIELMNFGEDIDMGESKGESKDEGKEGEGKSDYK